MPEPRAKSRLASEDQFKYLRALGGSGGTHPVSIREKSKGDGKTTSTYVHKLLSEDAWVDPYIASIEAITSEMFNFICPNINPKTRVVTQYSDELGRRVPSAVVSKNIEGYKVADKLTKDELIALAKGNPRQMAGLLVSIYVLEENDLHGENWGINSDGDIVKIDNDRALFGVSSIHQGLKDSFLDIPIPAQAKEQQLARYPNEAYSTRNRFTHVSARDIMQFPLPFDAKPNNHPLIPGLHPEMSQTLRELFSDDNPDRAFLEQFKDHKYYFLTKALLLNQRLLKDIADAHSFDNDDSKSIQLVQHYKDRVNSLMETLLAIPEYQDFVVNYESKHGVSLEAALEMDIRENHNSKCYYKPGGPNAGKEKYPKRLLKEEEYKPELCSIIEKASINAQLPQNQRDLILVEQKLKDADKRLEREGKALDKLKKLGAEIEAEIREIESDPQKKVNEPEKLQQLHYSHTFYTRCIKMHEDKVDQCKAEQHSLTQERHKLATDLIRSSRSLKNSEGLTRAQRMAQQFDAAAEAHPTTQEKQPHEKDNKPNLISKFKDKLSKLKKPNVQLTQHQPHYAKPTESSKAKKREKFIDEGPKSPKL